MPDVHDMKASDRQTKIGNSVFRLTRRLTTIGASGLEYTGMSIRTPRSDSEEFLLTLRALDADGQPVVAFHSAMSFDELLMGLENRMNNGSLKWRPDQWGR